MKVSLNWLNDYVDVSRYDSEQIADVLTEIGLEVEGIEVVSPFKGEVVVGQILSAEKHPDADKLQICQVNVGEQDPLTIVCGAPNARSGLKTAVAKVGAVLPGDFKIKASKVRGQKSSGMMCAETELEIGSDDAGIVELADSLEIGLSITAVYGLQDTVFEVGLTPNRADCLGYIGLARDLAAKLDLELKYPSSDQRHLATGLDSADHVTVDVQASSDCGRFSALYIKNAPIVESPLWLKKRLENGGMRPLNLVVDVTNYVMLEWSAPIHAYDERFVKDRKIIVRRGKDGEILKTLDGEERCLTSADLVIADSGGPIGLAGVMGGENSEVRADTVNLIVEVAHFSAQMVRRTSKRLGIHSEASHRFERGTDITAVADAAMRVGGLLYQCYGELGVDTRPEVAAKLVDYYPVPLKLSRIALRLSRIRMLLGLKNLTMDECVESLLALGFAALDQSDDRMVFEVPSWRRDVEREIDLVEEVARMIGFDRIPYTMPKMEIRPNQESPFIDFCEDAKLSMCELGFNETVSFPFIAAADLDSFNLAANHPLRHTVRLANPLVEEQSFLHTSLAFVLVKALVKNRRHGDIGGRLFEVAKVFFEPKSGSVSEDYPLFKGLGTPGLHFGARARQDDRPQEHTSLCGLIDQPWLKKSWRHDEQEATFFHGKSVIIDCLSSFGVSECIFKPIDAQQHPWLHPGASALVYKGDNFLGYVGELHPKTAFSYGVDFQKLPIVFELDLEVLYGLRGADVAIDSVTQRFPAATRDLAFVVDRSLSHERFAAAVGSFNRKKNLKSFDLFDIYEGDNIPEGKKSIAYSFAFHSPKKTLTDKEVDKEVQGLLKWLKDQGVAELR